MTSRVPSREGEGTGAGGTRLAWRVWEPPPSSPSVRGRLLLVHGLGEHSGRYDTFARLLARNGVPVFSFDLRGHGRSQGPRGHVRDFSLFLDDLRAMEGVMEGELVHRSPRFLMGHSMGGLIALQRLREGPSSFDGAVFSAPWLATNLPGWVRRLGRWLGRLFPGLSVSSGTSPERLTRDPVMIRELKNDPLVHRRLSARLFREAEELQARILSRPGLPPLPYLFLIPTGDVVVRPRVTESFARGIVGDEIRIEILEETAHEPLNDLGREEVRGRILSWLLGETDVGGNGSGLQL